MPKPGEDKWTVQIPIAVKEMGAGLRDSKRDERLNGLTVRMVVRMEALGRLWPTLPEEVREAILRTEEAVKEQLRERQDELVKEGGSVRLSGGRPLGSRK